MIRKIGARIIDKNEVEDVVARLITEVLSRFTPRKIYLFGSAARNELTDASDFDVALLVSNDIQVKACKRALYGVARRIGWAVDFLVYSEQNFADRSERGGVCTIIRDEGKIIWEAAS